MAVYLENDVLIIEDEGSRDFYSLKNTINRVAPGRIEVSNYDYVIIKGNIVIKGNTSIVNYSLRVTFTGEHIHVLDGATLAFGYKYRRGNKYEVSHTCNVTAPNAKTFGSPTGHAGKLIVYGGVLNIFCDWNFTGPRGSLDFYKCRISGYGVYNGEYSRLEVVDFIDISPSKGVIKPTITPKVFRNIDMVGVKTDDTATDTNMIVLDSDTGDINWTDGTIGGYNNLLKVLDSSYSGNINLLGCIVTNGYNIDGRTNNMNLYHKLRFSGTLIDINGAILPRKKIVITDTKSNTSETIESDVDGNFDTWIIHYQDKAGSSEGEYLGPYLIEAGDTAMKLNITSNMVNIPLLYTEGKITINEKLQEITQLLEELSSDVSISEESIKGLIGTVIIALGNKINTTVDTIENAHGVKLTL